MTTTAAAAVRENSDEMRPSCKATKVVKGEEAEEEDGKKSQTENGGGKCELAE